MDFGALPPEVNSARMYTGPGSAPMLAAATAWDRLAAELSRTASLYQTVVDGLISEGWLGPASSSMAAAVNPFLTWMNLTGLAAEDAAAQATAAAGAYESAFAMTVPPPVVAANRARLMALIATNILGINTAAIAATEAEYGEMWAQDAAAMYGYANGSAAASTLKSFVQPPQTTNASALSGQAAAVAQATGTPAASGAQETLTQAMSAIPAALQQLGLPIATGGPANLWDFLDSNFVNGFVSAGYTSPAILQQTVTAAMADINAVTVGSDPTATALPPVGAGSGNATWTPLVTPNVPFSSSTALGAAGMQDAGLTGVSAQLTRASQVGRLSVPDTWLAAAQVENHAGAALPGGGWNSTALEGSGMPGMPGIPAVSTAGRHFGSGPRYGFNVTVMPRPPAAG
ncbi:PPE family protein [Mycobacterium sp. Marseille-P9652]|uniref:PPE family protein n=1 Tax=Mycobacterium sp. Marseille-P9652 TaxID=2654950 RepID=UPI0012E81C3E|nr:PPE family protein [Mycobacterium sp. Marseille-P9652]